MRVDECVTAVDVVTAKSESHKLWDSIIVDTAIKDRLRNQALLEFFLRPQLDFTVTALHGQIVLYGPPGTGKTTLARGLPYQLVPHVSGSAVRFIEVNPHGLMSAEHGQSQQRVSELLADHVPSLAADGMPTIVLLDEVESMAVARSQASLSANPADVHRATDAVLTALDQSGRSHPHLMFIATSNFTSALDDAFLSRADVAIEVPLPNTEALSQILRDTLTALSPVSEPLAKLALNPRIREVAKALEGVDGRRARKLVFEALAADLATVMNPGDLTVNQLLKTALGAATSTPSRRAAA